ncbi:MAG: lipoprotein-releasing ABC transporter permease subunit [Deltaproteobacteria bacterium]|nr:lipoprotein-releasing ABC transporter permease subunit [Deltaproteobacteria bacterium]
MSYELFISLRYLRARRKQVFVSVITMFSIAGIFLGVAALIIVLAVMNGFETDLRTKILGINAHVVLMQYGGVLRDYDKVLQQVAREKEVVAVTPFIYSQAMLKKGESVSGVILRGMDTETASRVINLGKMQEGKIAYLEGKNRLQLRLTPEGVKMPGVVLGKELAKNLGIFLFDTVFIMSPQGISSPMGMMPRLKKFIVVGVFDSGFYEYDSTIAFLALGDAQEFLNMGELVTGLEVKVNDIYQAGSIARQLEKKLGYPYWARHWMEMNKNLFAALRMEKRVMFIILSLIVLVAMFNIITTLIMVVMEKNRDIAILKAMGATSRSIMKIFIYQGLIIGVIGTFLGAIGGLAVAYNLEKLSLFVERIFGFKILPADVYYLSALPSLVNYRDVATIILGTLFISLLATIYPSWRASRLDPAETLRYD